MKTKKLVLILPFLFLIIGIEACGDKEPRFEIYENHDISACGVDDPLRNLDWLAEFTAKAPISNDNDNVIGRDISHYNIRIELYGNIETQEEYIVFFLFSNGIIECRPAYLPYFHQVYSCLGERLFVDSSGSVNGEQWNDFFHSGKNESQGIIWDRIQTN